MANEQVQPTRRTSTEAYNRLGQEKERLRLRALDLKRQREVLENELQSPGIAVSQRDFLAQRLQTLSNDEDQISLKLAQTERQLQEAEQATKELEIEQLGARLERQATLNARSRQLSRASIEAPEDVQRIQVLSAAYSRGQQAREGTFNHLAQQAKRSAALIVLSAVLIAVIAEILSLADLGWIVSWSLTAVLWFIARRTRKMDRSLELITTAHSAVSSEYQVLLQRLRPALVETGQIQSFLGAESPGVANRAMSYMWKFFRDQAAAQIIELIPVIDAILPMYLASVVKTITDQRSAYRKSQQALIPYRRTLDLLASLEQFDIDYRMGLIPRAQKSVSKQAVRRAPSTSQSNPIVRDIGGPVVALSPA